MVKEIQHYEYLILHGGGSLVLYVGSGGGSLVLSPNSAVSTIAVEDSKDSLDMHLHINMTPAGSDVGCTSSVTIVVATGSDVLLHISTAPLGTSECSLTSSCVSTLVVRSNVKNK